MYIVEKFATLSPCWVANVNRVDSRYIKFQDNGPEGLMLHSIGCAQPNAATFDRWNNPNQDSGMVHAFIDANDGHVRQFLRWNYRGWHCGSGSKGYTYSANNTHIGVEMCESSYIKYTSGTKFTILDKAKAQAHCSTAYNSAVELFAFLCDKYKLNPLTAIISHREGAQRGIASGHGDPEHYWTGLGMSYTMDGFRADVKAALDALHAPAPAPAPAPVTAPTEPDTLTRADVVAIFNENFAGVYKDFQSTLQDNDAGEWSATQRAYAIDHGLIAGIGKLPDGTPNYAWQDNVTREQLVVFLYRAFRHIDKLEARIAALEEK